MKIMKLIGLLAIGGALAACEGGEGIRRIGDDKSIDGGVNAHHLSTLVAGVWVDPEGCVTGSSMTASKATCQSV